MKKLIELDRRERTLISCGCDTFFLCVNKTKITKTIYDYLKVESGLPNRYNKELWMVITAIGKCLRSGASGTQIPLSTDKYTTANKIHKLALNATRASFVLKTLHDKGLVTVYLGYKDLKFDMSMSTCVIPSGILVKLYTPVILKSYKANLDKREMVVVTDSTTKQPFMKLTKFKGISFKRDFMSKYNDLLRKNTITISDVKAMAMYKQVFADDLEGAGRIYSFGTFQTTDNRLRKTIRINGNKTTEVDVRGMHVMLLYSLQGLVVEDDFDPYTIDNSLLNVKPKECRKFCKMAMMCMINCDTKPKAIRALNNKWFSDSKESLKDRDYPNVTECDYALCKKIITELEKHNSTLDFFDTTEIMWKKLQRLDSRFMENVISDFVKAGLVCLGWHDSIVSELSKQDFLITSMKKSWYKIFGNTDNFYYDIEF